MNLFYIFLSILHRIGHMEYIPYINKIYRLKNKSEYIKVSPYIIHIDVDLFFI